MHVHVKHVLTSSGDISSAAGEEAFSEGCSLTCLCLFSLKVPDFLERGLSSLCPICVCVCETQ